MARRCSWCNRIITEERKTISQSSIDILIRAGVIDPDFEKNQPLPICIDCLKHFGADD